MPCNRMQDFKKVLLTFASCVDRNEIQTISLPTKSSFDFTPVLFGLLNAPDFEGTSPAAGT